MKKVTVRISNADHANLEAHFRDKRPGHLKVSVFAFLAGSSSINEGMKRLTELLNDPPTVDYPTVADCVYGGPDSENGRTIAEINTAVIAILDERIPDWRFGLDLVGTAPPYGDINDARMTWLQWSMSVEYPEVPDTETKH